MQNKCDNPNCSRTDLTFCVTRTNVENNEKRMITRHYCSGIHAMEHMAEEWLESSAKYGKTSMVRLGKTVLSILKKAAESCEKEWKKTA